MNPRSVPLSTHIANLEASQRLLRSERDELDQVGKGAPHHERMVAHRRITAIDQRLAEIEQKIARLRASDV